MSENPGVIFREEQTFSRWWVWVFLVVVPLISLGWAALTYWETSTYMRRIEGGQSQGTLAPLCMTFVIFVAIGALFLCAKLITEVRPDGLYIRFRPFHLSFHKISLENLDKVEPIIYSPLRDYGGWGIRYAKAGKAYNPTGNRGVRLQYSNGKHILIGSGKPEELAAAIAQVR